jgi:tetratricopeptide (TPR) repeat protein
MQYFLPISAVLIILVIITRPFTVLFHELGHAIPAMLLTNDGATIFVGSYGDKKHSFKIAIGKLEIWVRYNPRNWHGGLCIPIAKDIPVNKIAIYTLCGPLFSLLIASILCSLAFVFDASGFLKLVSLFALVSVIIDLFNNLIPRTFTGADGVMHHSDGHFLFNLKNIKRFPDEFTRAAELFNTGQDYEQTAKSFDDFISNGFVNEHVYRLGYFSYFFLTNYEKAYSLQKELETKYQFTSDDCYMHALTCDYLKLYDDTDAYFNKSLKLNPENQNALTAVGYQLHKKGEYTEALKHFDKALQIQPDLAHAYTSRSHTYIELGNLVDALKDLEYSLQLDKENSYTYRNLGIYHLAVDNNEQALRYFVQAKEMDNETELIDEYISKARATL